MESDASFSTSVPLRTRFCNELRQQMMTTFPALMGMLLYKFPWLISLRFVGGIGAQELAAAALAATLCNVTGLSVAVGLSSALTTLTGQARGDLQARLRSTKVRFSINRKNGPNGGTDDEKARLLVPVNSTGLGYDSTESVVGKESQSDGEPLPPLVYLYRGLFIQMVLVLPIGMWWIYGIRPVLLALGQEPSLSRMTEQYLRILTVGLWSYSINWTLTAWLQALELADVPAYAASVGLATHIPFNVFFVYTLDWGYLGCAVATVTFQLIQPLLMIGYLFMMPSGKQRLLNHMAARAVGRIELSFWQEAKIGATSLKGILQYLGLALPGVVIISEWWASEVSIFLAGRLSPSPELALGGMTLYQSINSFCFMFPVSIGVSGSTRVGNLLGSGESDAARFAGNVSILCAGATSGILACALYFVPHTFFPSLFAPDEEDLIRETSATVPLLAVYVFADGIQSAFNGIVKGCGRQVVIMPIVIIAYWIVAMPLGYYLAFLRHDGYMCDDSYFCGIVGLVTGMTMGTWVHMILLGVAVIAPMNWELEANKARERVGTHQEVERRLSATENTLNSHDILSM
jgi:MATE family multidrug resistance protein